MVVVEHKVKCLGNDGLQGQQPSAQGNTLGNNWKMCNAPSKGKSFMHLRLFFCPFRASFSPHHKNHRAVPWAKSSLAFQAV